MAMTITSHFNIDVPRDVAWKVLTDIERSAPCFPGAELGEQQPDGNYKGAFHVKLGPLSFRFAGKFGFMEMNPEAGTAKVSASGTDTKGRGGAQAVVNVSMVEVAGHTEVTIVSDVTLSGSVAQYGRGTGMIQALSQQLINDFAKNLSSVMVTESSAAEVSAAIVEDAPVAAPHLAAESAAPRVEPAPRASAPASLSGGNLLWRVFLNWLRSKFSNSSSRR
jgi:carbon monoxide dehydrogenase subunit G